MNIHREIASQRRAIAASIGCAGALLGVAVLGACQGSTPVPAAMTMRGAIYDPASDGATSPTLRATVELTNQGATGPGAIRWPVQGEFRGHMSLAATTSGATVDADMTTSKTAKTSIWTKALGVAGTIAGYAYGKTS